MTSECSSVYDIQMLWDVRIRMRDSIYLSAMVYLPKQPESRRPAIIALTPYTAQGCHAYGTYFAQHGYAFVAVDVRGRGNSQGSFEPFRHEAADGYDVAEWVSTQPFCDGKVGMWGGSYLGFCQWVTAAARPRGLATIVPIASPYIGVDFPTRGNIMPTYLIQWLTLVAGRTLQDKIFSNRQFWIGRFRQWLETGTKFEALDTFIGTSSSIFQEWLAHPCPDEYWDRCNPTTTQYEKISIPVLTVTGIYDDDQLGALTHYRQHSRSAADNAGHYLVIGPWDHAGAQCPKAEVFGLKLGPAALLDLPRLHLQWYDWIMEGGARPEFLRNNVVYYVIGAEIWRDARSLDAITERHDLYYLHSCGKATDVLSAGALLPEPQRESQPDSFLCDPRDTTRAALESLIDPNDLTDQSLIYGLVGKLLVYHSPPLGSDIEISGFFRLSVWISIDQPDTDLRVDVYEIGMNGCSLLLGSDWIRARYRENPRKETLIHTTEPLRYDFKQFPFISKLVRKGSRLRLVVGTVNSIYSEKNYNAGGAVSKESVTDAQMVNVRLFHDHEYPSALYIPIGQLCSQEKPSGPACGPAHSDHNSVSGN